MEIEIFTDIAEAINTSILAFLGVIYEFQLWPKSILPFTPYNFQPLPRGCNSQGSFLNVWCL
jgi:hypothetical protein